MGLFTAFNKTSSPTKSHSIVGCGSEFLGNLTLKGSLHLDGKFEGNIISESNVTIGEQGRFTGFINAQHIIISGRFNGQLTCGVLEVLSTGEVYGDVSAAQMHIDTGAKFFGHSHNHKEKTILNCLPIEARELVEKSSAIDLIPAKKKL